MLRANVIGMDFHICPDYDTLCDTSALPETDDMLINDNPIRCFAPPHHIVLTNVKHTFS